MPKAHRLLFALAFALLACAGSLPAGTASVATEVDALIDAGWRVQQRWQDVASNGSFEYDFELRAWNSANLLKESIERIVRVTNRRGESRSEVVLARKDGKDETREVRAEQARTARKAKPGKKEELPSPFDPKFRHLYVFRIEPPRGDFKVLSFRPVEAAARTVVGEALYDGEGRLRKALFALARNPMFTRRLDFTIAFDESGNPVRVDSTGEVSLIVWKRRFESGTTLRDVRLGPAASVPTAGRD